MPRLSFCVSDSTTAGTSIHWMGNPCCLSVGSNRNKDPMQRISPDDTLSNVHAICKVLSNMGKMVVVCTVSTWGDAEAKNDALLELNMRRNDLLVDYLQS
jgi:hypothetical protein